MQSSPDQEAALANAMPSRSGSSLNSFRTQAMVRREGAAPAGELIEQAGAQQPPEEGLCSLVRAITLARGRQLLGTPRPPALCAPQRLEA